MKKVTLIHKIISTGFGTGYFPYGPGTMGAFVATMIWLLYSHSVNICSSLWITVSLIVIFTILGVWSSSEVEKCWGEDPSRVVVDEMVGVWITLLAVPDASSLLYVIGAFILFRFFDILKPLGIRKMEKFPGGYGIMLDDILSGIYGFIVLYLIRWVTD